ncbi:NACHT domain-containing protein [Psychromonas arctica]|uniref:NACHT domain-containing protein n=1 Tax=Psychromonas arctica TaxID=168275 RepID=A0ABU9HBI6_9GAMM
MNNKTKLISNNSVNFNDFSDRRFEEFSHRLFEFRIQDELVSYHDKATLMCGVGEKGRDISLYNHGTASGLVQCKLNSSGNLTQPSAAKEIIKFVLHSIIDSSLIPNIHKFQYYFVISHKAANTTIELLNGFNKQITQSGKLEEWTTSVIGKYEAFNKLKYKNIKKELIGTLNNLKVEWLQGSDINGYVSKYQALTNEFFEIKTVLETQPVLNELQKISDNISPDLKPKRIVFLKKYKETALTYLSSVRFIGHATRFNKPQNMTISSLYVEPLLKRIQDKKDTEINDSYGENAEDNNLTTEYILNSTHHQIILGDPGAGKSLLVKNIMIKIFELANETPFRVELRKYIQENNRNNLSILEYLKILLNSEYQLEVEKNILEEIIEHTQTVFLFDGLDEIFDISQKENTVNVIKNFCNSYPKVKCIVTSRFIGFNDVEFDKEYFDKLSILPFIEPQVEEFIDNFFSTQINNKKLRVQEATNCKSQIQNVSVELKSNPLILSLMSMLALNNVQIPDSRLEVYESITETLVEKRDIEEKELKFDIKNIRNIKGAFSSLAYWQYCQNSNDKKATNEMAILHIADYLFKKRNCDDIEEAKDSAEKFIKYAEKRSIYFDNNFTHKTFSEYYTANFICMNYNNNPANISLRDKVIKDNLGDPVWHVVFELLFSMIDKQVDDYEVIENLFKPHLNTTIPLTSLFLLSQIRILSNMDKDLIANIFENVIYLLINLKLVQYDREPFHEGSFDHDEVKLAQLLRSYVDSECKLDILAEVMLKIETKLKSKTHRINFYSLACTLNSSSSNKFYNNESTFEDAAQIDTYLYKIFYKDKFSLKHAMKVFKSEQLFERIYIRLSGGTFYIGLIERWLRTDPKENDSDDLLLLVDDIIANNNESVIDEYMSFSHVTDSVNVALNLFKCFASSNNKHPDFFEKTILSITNGLNLDTISERNIRNVKIKANVLKLKEYVFSLKHEKATELLDSILSK